MKARNKNKNRVKPVLYVVLAVLIVLAAAAVRTTLKEDGSEAESAAVNETQEAETEALPVPDEPAVESTATIGVTGDILIHNPVLYAAENADGTYDFSDMFSEISEYWQSPDYMIVNLEVTLGGDESGGYSGYPLFNCPDVIIDNLADAGVDMFLTANNHAYDSGEAGLLRTQEVISEAGLDYTGTRMDEDDSFVLIKDINGIIFGFVCYTYETTQNAGDTKTMNGITMSETAQGLISSFSYADLNSFYEAAAEDLEEMDEAGCDVKIVFIHWGDEYDDEPNDYQLQIAQELADLGTDVIIGGHPHVVQAFDVLEGEDGNTTYCLYSMGNAISNQRASLMSSDSYRGYTEDGVTFEITYEKLNNGKVRLSEIYILPTWVDDDYTVVPLDYTLDVSDWGTANTSSAVSSYNRTLGRLGSAYTYLRETLGLAAVPQALE